MATITVNGHTVQAASQQEGGTQFVPDASQSNFILIHCHEFLKNDQIDTLKGLGVVFLEYIADSTYLCQYGPKDLDIIRQLPFVVYANVYHQDLVVNSSLKEKASRDLARSNSKGDEQKRYNVYVVFHHESATRSTAEMRRYLAEMLHLDPSTITQDGHRVHMSLQANDLERVANIDDVQTIEEIPKIVINNYAARPNLRIEDTVPAYPKAGYKITQNMYDGDGEIVVVTDTGFDKGSAQPTTTLTVHPAFADRVIEVYNVIGIPDSTMDKCGHGTHVCGSVAGDGWSNQFGCSIKGTAPCARLVVQSMGGGIDDGVEVPVTTPGSLTDLFVLPYIKYKAAGDDACIYTNSWLDESTDPPKNGLPIQLGYTTTANTVDQVMYNYKDLFILFAAGNNGAKRRGVPKQIGAEAAAKNCLTVGACESSKPLIAVNVPGTGLVGDQIDYRYLRLASGAGDINNVADFSSQGLTIDGRIKPDVIAPGIDIYSARSQFTPLSLWPYKNDDAEKSNDFDRCGGSTEDLWVFMSGTSMATPLVAGCSAVIRQYLKKTGRFSAKKPITSALIKALLINGTADMRGSEHSRGPNPVLAAPNPVQGFGRVNQAASLRNIVDGQNGGFLQSPKKLKQGDRPFQKKIKIRFDNMDPTVSPPTPLPATLKVTLVYTDPPGPALNNSLLLRVEVKATDDVNTLTANGSNNVQKLVWENIPQGTVRLVVEAPIIAPLAINPTNDQDFALVWYVEYGPPKAARYQNSFSYWSNYRPSMEALRLAMIYK